MIRIDEIYNNTFWPFIKQNIPLTRMFYCDPPGASQPENIISFGTQYTDLNYIFFHDQEPIHLDIHKDLFVDIERRNEDCCALNGPEHTGLVTSEYNSDIASRVCSVFGWKHYYYFFHGWAALDWYRGYNNSFLMPRPQDRKISRSFISANRIIGGKRDHRVLLMYHLLKSNVSQSLMSFPRTCPVEQLPVVEIAKKFSATYPDIVDVFAQTNLPYDFPGESGHPMHSCWLSLFDEHASSMVYVITETVFAGQRHHLTEKSFKPICLRMPFVMVSTQGSLSYLRKYGFKTFGDIWDESYDDEVDDNQRLEKIAKLLKSFDQMTVLELEKLYQKTIPIIEHNYNHFYGGSFESVLWQELVAMLEQIKTDFNT